MAGTYKEYSFSFLASCELLTFGDKGQTNLVLRVDGVLTAHNWQKWKRVFLTCPCHEIYRDEAVGLKSRKYTWKITIYVNMWNLGQFQEKLIFCQ